MRVKLVPIIFMLMSVTILADERSIRDNSNNLCYITAKENNIVANIGSGILIDKSKYIFVVATSDKIFSEYQVYKNNKYLKCSFVSFDSKLSILLIKIINNSIDLPDALNDFNSNNLSIGQKVDLISYSMIGVPIIMEGTISSSVKDGQFFLSTATSICPFFIFSKSGEFIGYINQYLYQKNVYYGLGSCHDSLSVRKTYHELLAKDNPITQ